MNNCKPELIKEALKFASQLRGMPYKTDPKVRKYLLSLQENMNSFERSVFLGAVNSKNKWPRRHRY